MRTLLMTGDARQRNSLWAQYCCECNVCSYNASAEDVGGKAALLPSHAARAQTRLIRLGNQFSVRPHYWIRLVIGYQAGRTDPHRSAFERFFDGPCDDFEVGMLQKPTHPAHCTVQDVKHHTSGTKPGHTWHDNNPPKAAQIAQY